jgi:dihydropteroate synthase
MREADAIRVWRFAGKDYLPADAPRIMGIVNVTPDSFSDGGRFFEIDRAVDRARELLDAGADFLDVGGESTRPGAAPVPEEEECRRVIPIIVRLAAATDVPISIDTTKSAVAREALAAGAQIVNDISALTFDPHMVDVCAGSACGVIVMHMRGTPQTMQDDPQYANVVNEIVAYLNGRLDALAKRGIERERIVVDPGVGFGKTAAHNVEILSRIAELHALGRPVLIGHSRKQFLGKLLGRKIDERTSGTIGVAIALAQQRTDILRVHDVAAVKDALTAWRTITGAGKSECKTD